MVLALRADGVKKWYSSIHVAHLPAYKQHNSTFAETRGPLSGGCLVRAALLLLDTMLMASIYRHVQLPLAVCLLSTVSTDVMSHHLTQQLLFSAEHARAGPRPTHGPYNHPVTWRAKDGPCLEERGGLVLLRWQHSTHNCV